METKGKYRLITPKKASSVDTWKIPLLPFIVTQIKQKYDLSINELLLLMYLSFFKYVDAQTIAGNSAVSNVKYAVRMLNKLHKLGLVDRVNFALEPEIYDVLPEFVYMLSSAGKRLINKVYQHLNGTEEIYEFKI